MSAIHLRGVWILLVVVTITTRFAGLGLRALSHDESLHAFYSWEWAEKGEYLHDPMMHGPLLFHMNAVVFKLFGDTDFTSRLVPALFGIATVLYLRRYRRWLGEYGALAAAMLVAFDPGLWYYSRYIRNDIYITFFNLLWLDGALRFVERPRFVHLAQTAGALALSFSCKEVAFIHGAIWGLFFSAHGVYTVLKPHTGKDPGAGLDLCAFWLCLVLPFASATVPYFVQGTPLSYQDPDRQGQCVLLAGAFAAAGLILGRLWHQLRKAQCTIPYSHWLLLCGLAWGIQALLFTAFFSNTRAGLASGFTGSLGYWLAQHEVQRASQPWFYYLVLLALYNFAALLIILLAGRQRLAALYREASGFYLALACWWVAALIGYSIAGEKMPWLLLHISLPLLLLAGRLLADMIQQGARDATHHRGAWAIAAMPLLAGYLAFNLPAMLPFEGRTCEAINHTMEWGRVALAYAILISIACLGRLWQWRPDQRLGLKIGFLFLLVILNINVAARLVRENEELAVEPIVYAHGTPGIRRVTDEIHRLSMRRPGQVAIYDEELAWPLSWHLRHAPVDFMAQELPAQYADYPLILVGADNQAYTNIAPKLAATHRMSKDLALWWPVDIDKNWTLSTLWALAADPQQLREFIGIVAYRDYQGKRYREWPHRREMHVFRKRPPAPTIMQVVPMPPDTSSR